MLLTTTVQILPTAISLLLPWPLIFTYAAAPPNDTPTLSPPLPSNISTLTTHHLPRPDCYSRFAIDKPRLLIQECATALHWFNNRPDRSNPLLWVQPSERDLVHIVYPPTVHDNNGCVISVYSRIPGATARFSLQDVAQGISRVLRTCERVGRGGKVQIYDAVGEGMVQGWYAKVDNQMKALGASE